MYPDQTVSSRPCRARVLPSITERRYKWAMDDVRSSTMVISPDRSTSTSRNHAHNLHIVIIRAYVVRGGRTGRRCRPAARRCSSIGSSRFGSSRSDSLTLGSQTALRWDWYNPLVGVVRRCSEAGRTAVQDQLVRYGGDGLTPG